MKRFLILVPMLVLSALLLCMPALAEGGAPTPPGNTQAEGGEGTDIPESPENPENPEKTVTGVTADTEGVNRILKLGETPDFTGTQFTVTYYDGSTETVPFDSSYLTEWSTEKIGRQPATLTVAGKTLTEYFVVYDDSVNPLKFKDVTKTYWGYKPISRAVKAGFFVGLSEDEFGVAEGMTRAQFCQMIYQIYRYDGSVMTRHKPASFTDVAVDAWYYKAVIACAESGIINGMGDGTFDPDSNITRQDVAVIMMNVLMGADNVKAADVEALLKAAREERGIAAGDFDNVSPYAKKYVAASLGVIYYGDEKGNINPKNDITRAECAAMCSNLYFAGFEESAGKKVVYLSPESDTSKVYAIWDRNDPVKSQYTEHIQMSLVADKVKQILEQKGYEVYIADPKLSIRDKDKNDQPQDHRGAEAKRLGADAYVAIHSNAAPSANSGSVQGATCYYNGNNDGSKELSDFIYKRLSKLTPTKDRGSLDDMKTLKPFAEVRLPVMANVLIEVEFHDYAAYAQWIVDNIDGIAECIAFGIDDYLQTLD